MVEIALLKFFCRHHELIDPFSISVSQLVVLLKPVNQQ